MTGAIVSRKMVFRAVFAWAILFPAILSAAIDVDMELNNAGFISFDHFRSAVVMTNPDAPLPDAQIFGVLEILGSYYFWPEFTTDVRWDIEDIETGVTTIVLLEFDFPDIDAFVPFGPMYFWGAYYMDAADYGYDVEEFWMDGAHKWTPTPTGPTATPTNTPPCTPYPVGGPITSDTTWSMSAPSECGHYRVESDVTVTNGATLTIEAGVQVFFASGTRLIIGGIAAGTEGRLTAEGTDGHVIGFTGETATPGAWEGIRLNPYAADDSSMAYCAISYGGSGSNAALVFDGCDPNLDYSSIAYSGGIGLQCRGGAGPLVNFCTISHNTLHGIHIISATPNIGNCMVTSNGATGLFIDGSTTMQFVESQVNDNGSTGLRVNIPAVSLLCANVSFSNNGDYPIRCFAGDLNGFVNMEGSGNLHDKIYAEGDTITGTAEWYPNGFPLLLTGELIVAGTGGTPAVLSIMGANDIQFSGAHGMTIGSDNADNPGLLRVNGTETDPVLFRADTDLPAEPGLWRGIMFRDFSVDAQCRILNADFISGGIAPAGTINCTAASPQISGCSFALSGSFGIRCDSGASPVVQDCRFEDIPIGMICMGTGTAPHITGSTFDGAEFGIYILDGSEPVIGGSEEDANSFSNSVNYGVCNDDITTCIDASHNYWGNANGPDDDNAGVDGCMNASNNNDAGDNVSEDVDYTPWQATEP